ncbi:MAG: hypothetical protein WCL54_02090 [Clostridia bacterium]
MFKSLVSKVMVVVLVFTMMFSVSRTGECADPSGPVFMQDGTTVMVDGSPAGLLTKIEDTGDGYLSISIILKGYVGWSSATTAMKYDKNVVVPVNVTTKEEMGDLKVSTGSKIAPFVNLLVTPVEPTFWALGGQIDNTTDAPDGNLFSIKYYRASGSEIMTVPASSESTIFKLMFKKINPKVALDNNTFTYVQLSPIIVTKFAQGTVEVAHEGTEVAGANPYYIRPDLFYLELIVPKPTPSPKPPVAPSINVVVNTAKTISGKAVTNGLVTVMILSKKYTKIAQAGAWKVNLPTSLKAGTKVSATVKVGTAVSAVKTTYVIPFTPVVKHIAPNSTSVKGKATKGSVVYAKIAGKTYTAKANAKTGEFSIKTPKIKKGSSISVTCKAGGKTSQSIVLIAK